MATSRSVMDKENQASGYENVLAGALSSLADLGLGWPDLFLFAKSLATGKSVREALQTPGVSAEAKKKLEELTNLPVEGATPGKEGFYAFGQGAIPIPIAKAKTGLGIVASMLGGAAAGGSISLVGSTLFPDSPAAQVALGFIPFAGGAARGLTRELVAAKYRGKLAPDALEKFKEGRLTLGELTGDPKILHQEEFFRTNPVTAQKAGKWEATRKADLENALANIVSKPVALSTEAIGVRGFKAFEARAEAVKKIHKDLTATEFKAALEGLPAHLRDKRIFDTSLINVVVTDLLNEYRGLAKTYDVKQVINQLEEIQAGLLDTSGMPKPLTGREFQAQLRQWGEKAATGEGLFKDVGVSTTKGIASKVFGAFTDTLQQTADNLDIKQFAPEISDVAAKLKEARSNFKRRSEMLEVEQKKPINRFFAERGITDAVADPEKVRNALLNSSDTERRYLFDVLEKYDPELATKIRSDLFDRLMQKGYVKGANDVEPKFSPEQFLKAFDEASMKDARFLADTLPDPKQRAEFLNRVGEMRKMASHGFVMPDDTGKMLSGAAATVTGMRAVESSFITNAFTGLRNYVVGKEQMYNYLFNPQTPGKTGIERFQNAMLGTAKGIFNQNPFNYSQGLLGIYRGMQAERELQMPAEAPKTAQKPPKQGEDILIPDDLLKGSEADIVIPDNLTSESSGMVSHEDFPKVSPEEQAQRDAVAQQLIAGEATGESRGEPYTLEQKQNLKRMRIQNIQQEMQLQRRNPAAIQALTVELQRELARP
jgi:hypothetical protein